CQRGHNAALQWKLGSLRSADGRRSVGIPMISDFLDRRGETKPCNHGWLDTAFIAVPAAGSAILTLSDTVVRWLSNLPSLIFIVQSALPVLVLAGMSSVISSRTTRNTGAGFDTGGGTRAAPQYRFCTAARRTAKIGFLPMLFIASASLWMAVPNGLRGANTAAGYICSAKGEALNGTFVQLLDRYDASVSNVVQTDDRGFFFASLAA